MNADRVDQQKNPTQSSLPTAALDAGLKAAFTAEENHTGVSVIESLCQDLGTVPSVILKDDVNHGNDPVVRPNSPELLSAGSHARYRLDGEIARGGMGAVIRGRDSDLGRELAIKVLLKSHQDKPALVRRFIEEAQIAGQLQHPGIAPVYELGQFSDDRPFFSMKLVKGKTLSALLSERQTVAGDRTRFLTIFEQVCQTMAYAHSRGVIHRDLKPSNIMVGAFGEVQVMDWGLAKVLGDGGVEDERRALARSDNTSIIETIRSRGSDTFETAGSKTQAGSVLGTPAYMPPEQALGEVDHLDERCDVFGLGAILCEILTGKPVYVAESAAEVYRMSASGKVDDCLERLDGVEIDGSLKQLALACIELEPGDRPRDAGVVADRMNEYAESVEQRILQADFDRIKANTRVEEERKRRKISVALAAVLLLACCLGGGMGWWIQYKEKQLAQVRSERSQKISSELATARVLGGIDGDANTDLNQLSNALQALKRAESELGDEQSDSELKKQITTLRNRLQQRIRDAKLIAELQSVWEWEINRLAESRQQIQARHSRWWGLSLDAAAELSEKYQRVFENWLGDKIDQAGDRMLKQVNSLAPDEKTVATVALERWQQSLRAPRSIEEWDRADWKIMRSTKRRSRGGDRLELLDDQSILASGNNPQRGYELVYETDQTTIKALRLEALLDDSLPRKGPGRGPEGVFAIAGLRVFCTPLSDPHLKIQLAFSSAVADYESSKWPLTTSKWHISGGQGEPHRAVFELPQSIQSESGFMVFIETGDRNAPKPWDSENLGRFRWSVCGPNSNTPHAIVAKVLKELGGDPWRNAMRREIAGLNVNALLKRARATDKLNEQPSIVRVELAEMLSSAENWMSKWEMRSQVNWQTLKPNPHHVSGVTEPTVLPDDSVFVREGSAPAESYRFSVADQGGPITALMLEFVPDSRLPSEAFSRAKGELFLSELKFALRTSDDDSEPVEMGIARGLCDRERNENTSVDKALDHDPETHWVFHGKDDEVVFALLSLEDPLSFAPGQSITVELEYGEKESDNRIGRLRLSATTDAVDSIDPRVAAIRLLRSMYEANPNDYWCNLSLAQSLQESSPADLSEAIAHATAAVALRPDRAAARLLLAELRVSHAIINETSIPDSILKHLRVAIDLNLDRKAFGGLVKRWAKLTQKLSEDGRFDTAKDLAEMAFESKLPDERLPNSLGFGFRGLGMPQMALDVFRHNEQVSRDQDVIQNLSWDLIRQARVLCDHHDFKTASGLLSKALKNAKTNRGDFLILWTQFELALIQSDNGDDTAAQSLLSELARRIDEIREQGTGVWGDLVDEQLIREYAAFQSSSDGDLQALVGKLDRFQFDPSNENDQWTIVLQNRLKGLVYERMGDLPNAIASYEQAATGRIIFNEILDGYWVEARLLDLAKQTDTLDRCVEFLGELRDERNRSLHPRHPCQAFTRMLLAEAILENGGKPDEVQRLLRQAKQMIDRSNLYPQHVKDRLHRLTSNASVPAR